jgi:hypothetical protein
MPASSESWQCLAEREAGKCHLLQVARYSQLELRANVPKEETSAGEAAASGPPPPRPLTDLLQGCCTVSESSSPEAKAPYLVMLHREVT